MARLRTIKPRLTTFDSSIAKLPPKVKADYYNSTDWTALRKACLDRDRYRCQAPGCTQKACVADHIVSRANGGQDVLSNLRSLCRVHDNRIKENHLGERRNGGNL